VSSTMAFAWCVSGQRLLSISSMSASSPTGVGDSLRNNIQLCFRARFSGVPRCLGMVLVHDSFSGLWHCLQISVLFVLWKLRCKFVFDQEISSLSAFVSLCKNEVCHQLFAKGSLLIKDTKSLDPTEYSDFVAALVILRNRL